MKKSPTYQRRSSKLAIAAVCWLPGGTVLAHAGAPAHPASWGPVHAAFHALQSPTVSLGLAGLALGLACWIATLRLAEKHSADPEYGRTETGVKP